LADNNPLAMQAETIIGRDVEINILDKLLQSGSPELLAIYGRRRIGKTFLINNYYRQHMIFGCQSFAGFSRIYANFVQIIKKAATCYRNCLLIK
jgi:AAA+ ATPase superfamily predicted ATPase